MEQLTEPIMCQMHAGDITVNKIGTFPAFEVLTCWLARLIYKK